MCRMDIMDIIIYGYNKMDINDIPDFVSSVCEKFNGFLH